MHKIQMVLKWVTHERAQSPALWDRLTMDSGWRGDCEVPQSVLEARVWVIRRCWWGRRGYKVGERDPLSKGVQTHGIKVLGSQRLGVVGARIEGLGQLVQGAVEGGFEDAGSTHTRGQTEGVNDFLWAGVWWQLTSEQERKKGMQSLHIQFTYLIMKWRLCLGSK